MATDPSRPGAGPEGPDAPHGRGPTEQGLQTMVDVHAAARAARASALIVLHSPYGGGADPLVKAWRRHLMDEREPVIEGRCTSVGGTYKPLRDIVRRYVRTLDDVGLLDESLSELVAQVGGSLGLPTVGSLAETQRSRDASATHQLRFFEVLGRLFVELGKRVPAVLVVHDLHAADSATRAALEYILANVVTDPVQRFAPSGRSGGFRGTVVVTTSDVDGRIEPLRATLGGRSNVHWLSLQGLEEARIREYLQSDEVVGRFTAACGGSVDALSDLLDALPGKIEDLYLRRIERLDRPSRRVLEVLAVMDGPAKPDFVLRVVDEAESPPSLSALADQRLIVRHVSRGELLVDLPGEANRATVYGTIPAERRRVLHGRVAAMLEDRLSLGESADIGAVAWHYLHSNVVEKAYRFALEAAERLHISFAYDRARDLLELLLPHLEQPDARAQVLERLVELCAALNAHDAALAHSRAHIEVSDLDEHAGILRKQAEILHDTGRYDEALERIDAARTLARDQLDDPESAVELIRLLGVEAECHYGKGSYERALEVAGEGLERCVAHAGLEPRRLAIHLRNTVGKVHLFLGDYETAEEAFGENRALARDLAWPEEEVRALFNIGTIALQQRRSAEAESIFEECLEFGAHTANPITRAFLKLNLAVVYQRTRRYADAMDAYLDGLATFQQSGNDLQFAVTAMNLGSLYETLGQFDKAKELVALSIEVTERRDIRYFYARSQYVLGSVRLLEGDWDGATAALQHAEESLERTGSRAFADRIRIALARAAHGAGNHALRDARMQSLDLTGDDADVGDARAEADLYTGYFALDDGDAASAIASLERALVEFERLDRMERIWAARLYLSVALALTGEANRARVLLRTASDLVASVAASLPADLRAQYLASGERARLGEALSALDGGRLPSLRPRPEPTLSVPRADDPEYRRWRRKYDFIVGDDDRLLHVFRMIDRVSASESTVLIQGQSGTGKELVAEAIHRYSPRRDAAFVKVNCAAFVETLLLSELFGHEKGAFTGAMARKKGRFEMANGGTLFLDEIGDISPNTQVALLRVLQERQFERVGGSETVDADVRLICATNRNLEAMVREGTFRLDLYYRLKGVVIELPPLSERRSDIPALVSHFCARFAGPNGPVKQLSRDAMAHLVRYSWPGNVRELENFVRSVLLFVEGERIELPDVRQFDDFFADGEFAEQTPEFFHDPPRAAHAPPPGTAPLSSSGPLLAVAAATGTVESRIADWALGEGIGLHDLRSRLEVELIRKALLETGANITQAAKMLDMTRPRLSQIVNASDELSELRDRLARE